MFLKMAKFLESGMDEKSDHCVASYFSFFHFLDDFEDFHFGRFSQMRSFFKKGTF